jgi:tRNA (adenine58-N1)-methyltransferase non-catalytic subunit
LGKYGSFHTNQIIGRPFHLTFEILDRSESTNGRELRIVPAAELHADALIEQSDTPAAEDSSTPGADYGYEDAVMEITKSNMNILDNPLNQKLTMAEIEALKRDDTGSSKELIAKIMASHSTLDQKTAFSLAKYTLRKNRKYMRRFRVLPLDVANLTDWMMNERDFAKVMELRNEAIGLVCSWANVHASGIGDETAGADPASRYLVVDDTGGLIIAALAERIGILQPAEEETSAASHSDPALDANSHPNNQNHHQPTHLHHGKPAMSATSNTITLIHANTQPNLSLLRYFSFDPNNATPTHPLYTHLKTLSWLQLLEPTSDPSYHEPESVSPDILASFKSSKRSAYYRKRRRWERTKLVVDETRAGGFNGLVIASATSTVSILHHLVPLLAGGSQVVIYSPHIEPLVEVVDLYSTARRTAFLNTPAEERVVPSADFPVDPTLLLSPMLQTARVRRWQVLPGRTHPLMIGRGGAEGYVFVATRVLPAEGKISARGRPPRRKKAEVNEKVSMAEGNGDEMGDGNWDEDRSGDEHAGKKARVEKEDAD